MKEIADIPAAAAPEPPLSAGFLAAAAVMVGLKLLFDLQPVDFPLRDQAAAFAWPFVLAALGLGAAGRFAEGGLGWPQRAGRRPRRDVWHLWAGYRFLADTAPPAPGPGLPELDAELAQLLGLARTIQEWALTFEPKRGPKKPLLYEDSAYLVPEHIALVPDGLWPEQPQWITDFLANFGKRRANGQ